MEMKREPKSKIEKTDICERCNQSFSYVNGIYANKRRFCDSCGVIIKTERVKKLAQSQKKHESYIQKKNCERCGKEFEYHYRNQAGKRFCSSGCAHQKLPEKITINCKWCGVEFESQRLGGAKYCSKECRDKVGHWSKQTEMRNETASKISESRKKYYENLEEPVIPWNKGKTNIYSVETIEKIRAATIDQMKNGRIKKTGIEKKIESALIDLEIPYRYSFILKNRQFDFKVYDDIIIECHGDFWHGNPEIYGEGENMKKLSETQIMKRKDDVIKTALVQEHNFILYVFWEKDIEENFEHIFEILKTIKKHKTGDENVCI